jgi:hypothetical protein
MNDEHERMWMEMGTAYIKLQHSALAAEENHENPHHDSRYLSRDSNPVAYEYTSNLLSPHQPAPYAENEGLKLKSIFCCHLETLHCPIIL